MCHNDLVLSWLFDELCMTLLCDSENATCFNICNNIIAYFIVRI